MEDAIYQEFLELEEHHWWFRGRRAIFVSLLERFVGRVGADGAGAERMLLDVGCGVGGMLGPMRAFGRVVGTDVTYKGLQHCQARDFPRLVESDGPAMPFRDDSLDCITAFDALEHIEDDVGTMAEIHRCLKPGGVFIASGPAYQFLYAHQDEVTHHVRRYTRGELVRKARSVGFEVLQGTYINFLLFPAILPAVLLIKLLEKLNPPETDRSNVGIGIPEFANSALASIFSAEARLLRGFSAPAGHSVVIVVRKPAA